MLRSETGQEEFLPLQFATRLLLALSIAFLPCAVLRGAQRLSITEIIDLARSGSPRLQDAILSTFEAKRLTEGTAWLGHGPNFFFTVRAQSKPELVIDGSRGPAMENLANSNLWYAIANIEALGKLHSFYYLVNEKRFGGLLDLPAFEGESYLEPGVPSGTLSPKIVQTSKIYDGMKSEYWIYVPAEYKPDTAAALMIFNDGGWYTDRNGNNPVLNVVDNLIAQKKIPVMICIFINPGDIADS